MMAMTLETVMREAVVTALQGVTGLNRVGDGDGEAGAVPYATLGEIAGSDWGAKDKSGRELRFAVTLADRGDAARLDGLAVAAEAALLALARVLDGWETGGVLVLRSRRMRRRDGLRTAVIECRVRGWPVE
jgi:hypothetical protein